MEHGVFNSVLDGLGFSCLQIVKIVQYFNERECTFALPKYSKMLDIIERDDNRLAVVFGEEVKGSGLIMLSCVLGFEFVIIRTHAVNCRLLGCGMKCQVLGCY